MNISTLIVVQETFSIKLKGISLHLGDVSYIKLINFNLNSTKEILDYWVSSFDVIPPKSLVGW